MCPAALYRWLQRPGDTEVDERQRRTLLPVNVVGLAIAAAGLSGSIPGGVEMFGFALCFIACSIGILWVLLRLPGCYTHIVSYLALPIALGTLLIDLRSAGILGSPAWPIIVILMDLLVVFESQLQFQQIILVTTVLYLAVLAVDSFAPFGLQNGVAQWRHEGEVLSACDCTSPPCPRKVGGGLLAWMGSTVTFVLDFYVTRGFATELRGQLQLVDTTVRVSERVAQLLAAYATDDARRVVAEEGAALPEELRASYEQLLGNLDSYRAYLPDSLLLAAQQQQGENLPDTPQNRAQGEEWTTVAVLPAARSAPGVGEAAAEVAICFTDIQSSTELWELHPQGMYEGLNIHNRVMRATYGACSGYEVKTIGDSFMVAFDCGLDALRFGLEAQLGLLRQRWPEDLLTHPLCQKITASTGEPLWGGLRVRIGVQHGPCRVERNPVTGRCDYVGHTVNTAARLEAVLRKGGLVAAEDSAVSALSADDLARLGDPVLHDAGLRELKGVKSKAHVWALVPQSLRARVAVIDTAPDVQLPDSERASITDLGSSVNSKGSQRSAPSEIVRGSLISHQSLVLGPRMAHTGHAGRPVGPITLKLQRCRATCAVARAELRLVEPQVAEHLPRFASAAALMADKTQGVVDCVLSACIVVTWNTSRTCVDHTVGCRHFLAANFRVPAHLGAASGTVLSGSIAAGRRSFTTVVGGCVDLATALAEEAERCGDAALAAGEVAEDSAAAGAADCAQLWQAPGSAPVTVWEVRASEGTEKWQIGGDDMGDSRSHEYTPLLTEAFHKLCAAEPGSEEQAAILAELRSTDFAPSSADAAARLLRRGERGTVRTRLMPPQWELGAASPAGRASPPDVRGFAVASS